MNRACPICRIVVIVMCVSAAQYGVAQWPEPLEADGEEIEVIPVQGNVSMIATSGSNIAVLTGDLGLIVVDTGNSQASENVVTAIGDLSVLPPRYIINTAPLSGHMAGNGAISEIGETLPGSAASEGGNFGYGIPIVGHANSLMLSTTELADDIPFASWPFSTFFGDRKDLYLNAEAIVMLHQPAAITQADLIVYFRGSDVLVTGDILDLTAYPRFYPAYGGSLQGVIDALNQVIEIAVPELNQQGGTLIIPGHGRIANESDVVEYRDMLTIIRDRISSMIESGLSFEEIMQQQPSLEYDPIYGRRSGSWTTSMFLEAVYEELR